MFKQLIGSFVVVVGGALSAQAATFTPTFDTPSFPGTQFNVDSDPSYNEFYSENFGIEVSNSYLYVDNRDTLDGVGIANGPREANGVTGQDGRIDFLDTTDFVDIDFVSIFEGGVYAAYDAFDNLIDEFFSGTGTNNGSYRFEGGIISYITFSGTGGQVGVSGLTYNYDGETDGVNVDIVNGPPTTGGGNGGGNPTDPVEVVPLPASGFMIVAACGLLAVFRRRTTA